MATKKTKAPAWERYMDSLSADDVNRYSEQIERQLAPREQPQQAAPSPIGTVEVGPITPEPTVPGFWDSRVQGLEQQFNQLGAITDAVQAGGQTSLASAADTARLKIDQSPYGLFASKLLQDATGYDTQQGLEGLATNMRTRSEANREATVPFRESLTNKGVIEKNLGEGILDASESAISGAASLIGGPVALAAVGDVYNRSYADARKAGLNDQDASEWAAVQAAPESVAFIPASRFLSKIPGLDSVLGNKAKAAVTELVSKRINPAVKAAMNATKTAVGEGAEETITGGLQDIAASAVAGMAQGDLAKYAETQDVDSLEDFASNRFRDFRAGTIMGGAISGPVDAVRAQREDTAARNQELEGTTNAALQATRQQEQTARNRDADLNRELYYAQQDAASAVDNSADIEAAYTSRQAEEQRQKELETEAGFQTIEREASLPNDRLERYAGVVERVPVNPAAPVTPEQVEADRFFEERDAAEQARTQEQEKQNSFVAARRQRLEAERVKAEKNKTAAEKRAETRRRNDLTDQVIRENPTLPDNEIANLVTQRVAAPQEAIAATPTANVATPTAVPEASNVEAEAVPDVRELARQAGLAVPDADASLGMAAAEQQAAQENPEFEPRLRRVVEGLASRNQEDSVGIQNLMRQGKLIVSDSPQRIGRESANAAEYDPSTNRMYVYLDNLQSDDAVPAMIAGLHEATHAGQFNDRQGRPDILAQMMSTDGANKASSTIRRAASGGNKIAQAAVNKAQAASPNTSVQELELVPYFVSEAAAARQGSLGTLRGVANDVISSGRNFLRKTGVNLDVNLQDIDSAVKSTANEIVQTDLAEQASTVAGINEPLNIIAGPSATGYRDAARQGRTYAGRVDGGERFEIADNRSELNDEAMAELVDGATLPLSEVLDHEELFRNYPALANVNVKVLPVNETAYGSYDYNNNTLSLNQNWIKMARLGNEAANDRIRNTVLHEAQHAIQNIEGFVNGASPESFINKGLAKARQRARENMNDVLDRFDLGRAVQKLNPQSRRMWDNEVKAMAIETRPAQAQLFLESGYLDDVNDRLIQRYGDTYVRAKEQLDKASADYLNGERQAFQTYLRDYGEAEARNTEFRSRQSPEQLAQTSPESTFVQAEGNIPVERTLDSTPYYGGIRRAPESAVLAMSPSPNNVSQLSNLKPTEQLFRILRHQTNYRTADINSAEEVFGQMERAINKVIEQSGRPEAEVKKEINDQLISMDNMQEVDKAKAWEDFSKKYPTVAPIVKSVRDQIDRNTLAIVRERLQDPRPTTPAEDREIRKLLQNRGKYMNRSYAAFQGQSGRRFAAARTKGFAKAVELVGKGKAIPEKLREHYDATMGAINFLTDRIQIPDRAVLESNNMEALERLYETWVGPINRVPYDATASDASAQKKALMINALDNVRADITPEMVRTEAEKIANSVIGITEANAGFGQSFSSLARDTGVLKERQAVPAELRRFLGEYTDPSARVLTTLAGQAGYLARARSISEIKREGNGSLVVSKADARKEGNERFSVELRGEQYGQLQGWYATPETANKIGTMTTMSFNWEQAWNEFGNDPTILTNKTIGGVVKGLRKASGYQKMATVVANPYKWVRNFVGSPLMAMRDGNINPFTYATGAVGAYDYIRNTWSGRVSDRLDGYVRYLGIESARVAEVQSILGSTLEDVIKGKANAGNTAWAKMKRTGRTVIAGYSMADAWTKIANFENRASILRNFYEAANIPRTEEQIMQEAGDDINYTNISYDRAGNLVRGLEKSGVSQYLPYFSEVFRTTFTNYIQAYRDIVRATDSSLPPKAAAIMAFSGMSRFAGNTMVTLGAPFALGLAGAALSGGDDDNWRRQMIGEFNKNQDLIYFGNNKEGMPVFLPASMADPIGPVTDLFRTWMFHPGTEQQKAEEVGKQMMGMYVAPSWIARMYDAVTRTTQPEPRLARMFPNAHEQFVRSLESVGVDSSTTNRTLFALESWTPDWLKSYDPRTQPNIDGNFQADTLSAIGAQFETLNPTRRLTEANIKQDGKRSAALNNVNVLLSNTPNLTGNELKSSLVRFKESELDRLKDVYALRVSLEKWGQDEKAIRAMLKDAEFANADISAIYSDNPKARLSLRSAEMFMEKKMKGMSAAERTRREAIYKENIRKLKASREFLSDLGITLEN
ncbi:hypothetical protein [Xanthomonas phage DES1]|nr:hypothetical protein [Xanthomonas phage DES1]